MRHLVGAVVAWPARWRRYVFVAKLRIKAFASGTSVVVDIARDVRIGRNVRIHVHRGTSGNVVRIGPGSRLDDGVFIQIRGGQLLAGERSDIRRGAVLSVGGRLELAGSNVLSYRTVVHCAEQVTIGRQTIVGEMATIVDSRHFHSDPTTWVYENSESRPVVIGENVWIAAKATVALGVTIGDRAAVGANSVVTADVAPETLVAGIPAGAIRGTMRDNRAPER